MGTLARQAEIGIWVQAPGKVSDYICKILQFSAFYPESSSKCRP